MWQDCYGRDVVRAVNVLVAWKWTLSDLVL